MSRKILLVEVDYLDPATSTTGTLRLTKAIGGYRTRPTDTPANVLFYPKLARCRFQYDSVRDPLLVGNGEIAINNADGAFDAILDYVYDAQIARLYEVDEDAAYSTKQEIARWTVEQPEGDTTITIRTRTPLYGADKSILVDKYGGGGGVDGGSELANKFKPCAFGWVDNAPAQLVDETTNVYQLSSGHQFASLRTPTDYDQLVIYDQGIVITQGTPYTSVSQMLSTPPAAGQCRICNAVASGAGNQYGVYVRFETTPADPTQVTFDARACPNGGDTFASTMLRDMLKLVGGSSQSDLGTSDLTLLAAIMPYYGSLYAGPDDNPTYLDWIGAVMKSIRGWVSPYQATPTGGSPTRPWAARWLDNPAAMGKSPYGNTLLGSLFDSSSPYIAMRKDQIVPDSFKRIAHYDFGWPEWRTTIGYDRLWLTQSTGLAGGVTTARRSRLAQQFLTVSQDDSAVLSSYPTAADKRIDTVFSSRDATIQDEADRQNGIFKHFHPAFSVTGRTHLYHAALTVPGDRMEVVGFPKHGCDVRRQFQITSISVDFLSLDTNREVEVQLSMLG